MTYLQTAYSNVINERGIDEAMQEQTRNLNKWYETAADHFKGSKKYAAIETPAKTLSELTERNLNESKDGYGIDQLQKFTDTFAKVKQIRTEIFKTIDDVVEGN